MKHFSAHFLKKRKQSSSRSFYYEEIARDSHCLNNVLSSNAFFGEKKPPSCLYEADFILQFVRDEGLQSIWRIWQKKVSAQNLENHLRIQKNAINLYHKIDSETAQQYEHLEQQVGNVLSRWAVNGKVVESHHLIPKLNVISESYLWVWLKF